MTSILDPNRVDCPSCGFPFLVSRKVLKRSLDCINCGSVWHYVRNINDPSDFMIFPVGGWESLEQREIAIELGARERADDIKWKKQAKGH